MARPKRSYGDDTKADAAMRALVDLFENLKAEPSPHRKYLLERVDGELVFRQTEVDAAVENAIAGVDSADPSPFGRRIIKLKYAAGLATPG